MAPVVTSGPHAKKLILSSARSFPIPPGALLIRDKVTSVTPGAVHLPPAVVLGLEKRTGSRKLEQNMKNPLNSSGVMNLLSLKLKMCHPVNIVYLCV